MPGTIDLTKDDEVSTPKDARLMHSNWCFTYNYGAHSQPDKDATTRFLNNLQDIAGYIVAGYEVAPTTGQLHVQGYCQLNKRLRVTALKKIPDGGSVHWEPAHGDEIANREYCLGLKPPKEPATEFVEFGEAKPVNAGLREAERWTQARKFAQEGNLDAVHDQIFIQHYSSLRSISRDFMKPLKNADSTTGLWIYGLTGSGKSRWAREKYGLDPNLLYLKPINKWWDGFRTQPYVLLEDFGKEHHMLGYHLKIWADRYAFPAEIKGSTIQARPKRLIVTSQYHPRDIWSDAETLDAILRRFKLKFVGDPENNPWNAQLVLPPPPALVRQVANGSPKRLREDTPRPLSLPSVLPCTTDSSKDSCHATLTDEVILVPLQNPRSSE